MNFFFYKKSKRISRNMGMTYIELIIVMAIFSMLYGVVMFNYQGFQARVVMKNLAVEVASSVTKAQQNSVSGVLPLIYGANWRPSYGVYFNSDATDNKNKTFYYFVDSDSNGFFNYTSRDFCPRNTLVQECLERINITRGNYISQIRAFDNTGTQNIINGDLSITFTRPDTSAKIKSETSPALNINYVEIVITSQSGISSVVRVYSSGRVDII